MDNWDSIEHGNNTFDPGDGGPTQRFWLGIDRTFVDGDVSVANDEITDTAHGFQTGEGPCTLTSSGTLPAGLAIDTKYWFIRVDADTYKFATSRANALADTDVDITAAAGGGTHTVETAEKLVVPAGVAKMRFKGGIAWATPTTLVKCFCVVIEGTAATPPTQYNAQADRADASAPRVDCDTGVLDVVEGEFYVLGAFQDSSGALNAISNVVTGFSCEVVEESRAITYPGVTVTPPWRGAHVRPTSDAVGVDLTSVSTVVLDTAVLDTDSIFNDTNDSLIVPAGVTKIIVRASLKILEDTGGSDGALLISKNGDDNWVGNPRQRHDPSSANIFAAMVSTGTLSVVEGDEFRLRAFMTGDTSVTIESDNTWLEMEIVETDEDAFPPEPIEFFINSTPAVTDLIYQKVANRRFTLSDDFAGSEAYFETAPSGGALVFDVDRNGTKIGEINFADGVKVATFTTTAGLSEVFDVGDRLGIDSPSNLHSATDLSIALWAWRS